MMPDRIVDFDEPVTLLGGGATDTRQLQAALALAPRLVAADGGANMAVAHELIPDFVIGDYDSVSPAALAVIPPERQMRVPEQETTDFEKCLSRIAAPLILGLGFLGPRSDHTLAAFSALVRHRARPCILIGPDDVIFACPDRLSLPLPPGMRLSLFPMLPVTGQSSGLRWPIDGLALAPDGRIGTSNQTTGSVSLQMSGPGMLVLLPPEALGAAIAALRKPGQGASLRASVAAP